MSHDVWFYAPLTCLNCGSHTEEGKTRLQTSSLNPDPEGRQVWPGGVMELHLYDLEDGYLELRQPGSTEDVHALEQWGCPACEQAQWARILFRYEDPDHYRFVSARTTALTPETVRDAHFISRNLDFWVETHTGEALAQVLPLVGHLLPRKP